MTFGRWPKARRSQLSRGLLHAARRTPHQRRLRRARRPCGPPARQPVPTAARDRAAPETQLVSSGPRANGHAADCRARPLPTPESRTTPRDGGHRRRAAARAALRAAHLLKGDHVERIALAISIHTRSPRARTRLRLSVVALTATDVVDVPTVVLKDPRTAAAVLAPLIADQPSRSSPSRVSPPNIVCSPGMCSRAAREPAPGVDAGRLRARVSHTGHDRRGRPQPSERRSHESGRCAAHAALCAAADVLDLPLLDHLIVGDEHRYFSFREAGAMGASATVMTTCRRFDLRILWKCSAASRLRSLRSPLARP